MDWLRAKLILIAAFVVLDAALAYRIFVQGDPGLHPSDLALPSEAQVRARLERAGLRLAGAIPDAAEVVPRLRVRPRPAPERVLAALVPAPVREGRAGQRRASAGGTAYRWADGRAWVSGQGWVIYAAAGRVPEPPGSYPVLAARADALAWLNRHGALPPDVRPAGGALYDPRRGAYALQLQQIAAGGLPLLDGGIRLLVARHGVVGFEWRLWDWEVPPGVQPVRVIPATRILIRELREGGVLSASGRRRGAEPAAAIRVGLGYRPEPAGDGARLVWRLAVGERLAYDFDAVTGARLPALAPAGGP